VEAPLKISVVDLGYNSLKLVNYEVREDHSFLPYEQLSVPARLGEGLHESGMLGEWPIRRTIEGLKLFIDFLDFESVSQILPVATSAVREARNKGQFLDQVYEETGLRFRVLSEKEEAFYSFAGTAASIDLPYMLFFDIGGGSLEMLLSENNRIRRILSLPLGGLRLTELFSNNKGTFSKKEYSKMRRHILDLLPGRRQMGISHDMHLVGVGGTVRSIARYDQMLSDYPLNKLHNYILRMDSVSSIHRTFRGTHPRDLEKIPEIGQDRAKSVVAGSLVIELVMKKWKFQNLVVSTHGLRDGVLSAFLNNPLLYHRGRIPPTLTWAKSRYDPIPIPHAKHFCKRLERYGLIDETQESIVNFALGLLRGLPLSKPEVLFSTVVNEDSKLSHSDQLLAALTIVRCRSVRSADWLYLRYKPVLRRYRKDEIRKLAVLLSLCELLERTDTAPHVSLRAGKLVMEVITKSSVFPVRLLKNIILDFENVFDLELEYHLVPVMSKSELVKIREAEG
jgi:exopolyphosphatase/guanosine-5'-triphosphate,3'-diphosphate pyrophosphatase